MARAFHEAAVTDMFRTLATFPKPVLACVDGDAVGVGGTIPFQGGSAGRHHAEAAAADRPPGCMTPARLQ
ncbi:hypothetical protein [Mesorhizobium sp. 128a]